MSSPDDASGFFTHEFEGVISRFGVGKSRVIWYRVLFLPPGLAATLPLDRHPRLRVVGEIADVPVEGAWMPTGDGRRYFLVSPVVAKSAEVDVGSRVAMRFRIDDQDRVEVPAALARALRRQPHLAQVWAGLTPGRRRGYAHMVGSAKSDATTAARIEQVFRLMMGKTSV